MGRLKLSPKVRCVIELGREELCRKELNELLKITLFALVGIDSRDLTITICGL
jgi:hypothetical protein